MHTEQSPNVLQNQAVLMCFDPDVYTYVDRQVSARFQ